MYQAYPADLHTCNCGSGGCLVLSSVISNPANLAQHQANLKVGPIFIAKIVPMSLGTFAISKTEKPQGGEPQSKPVHLGVLHNHALAMEESGDAAINIPPSGQRRSRSKANIPLRPCLLPSAWNDELWWLRMTSSLMAASSSPDLDGDDLMDEECASEPDA